MAKNKIVLSEPKQFVLATLYLAGIREVKLEYQRYLHPCYSSTSNSLVIKTLIPYGLPGQGFNFYELDELNVEDFEEISLEELIREYCPIYRHILEND